MNRFLITLLAALLVGGASMAQQFPDIPVDHWAGDAVSEIADLGIVIGFPDGTFRGNEAFTRYQAALVVSRLLSVVEANLDDMVGTLRSDVEGELNSLRAAVQDLAGDVASQGVRLSAAESAIAGISDDVAANASRLDALEAAMTDSAVLRDLQNQIASQRVAIDTAQAQAEAAAARADAAYDLALQALAESDQNAADIAALNRVVQLLGQRLDAMGVPMAAPMPDLSGIERLEGDIANIREFVILLRRDQVALRDRVAALEAADVVTQGRLDDLDARVTELERTALSISGSIALEYNAVRFGGCVGTGVDCGFDIDRVYGRGFNRTMGAGLSALSTGEITTGPGDARPAHRRAEFRADPGMSVTFSISVVADQAFSGTGGRPRMLQEFGTVAELDFVQVGTPLLDTNGDAIVRPFVLRVRSFTSTFTPIGMGPLSFAFGERINTRFTPYVFDIRNEPGFVATLGAPDFLAFLNPTLTFAYLDPTDDGQSNRTAIRGTLSPSFGDAIVLSGGFSYARSATGTGDLDPATTDEMTVWGLDGQIGLIGVINIDFEYATNNDAASILFVRGSLDGSGLPIINSLAGNFRSIDEDWDGIFTNPGASDDSFPFALDQTGFGIEGSLGLFIIDVGAFFDSYSVAAGDTVSAFGASTDLNLFGGFSIGAFYESVSVNGVQADNNRPTLRRDNLGYVDLDGNYETQFGVRLVHDGAAPNALIRGLALSAEYRRFNVGFVGTDLNINASYDVNIAIVSLSPYVGYRMFDDAAGNDFTSIIAGTSLMTTGLDFGFIRPSLLGAVNFRNTSYGTAGYTASELQWSVGLVLDEFLLGEFSTLTARYGQYSGTNTNTFWTDGAHGGPGVGRDFDADRGGASTTTTGWEVDWNYYDLEFAYGMYSTSDTSLGDRRAQQFRVRYSVEF
ncbi:S-layer homology domain-containing protein [soil metagenome]